jgi:hypothetical protein
MKSTTSHVAALAFASAVVSMTLISHPSWSQEAPASVPAPATIPSPSEQTAKLVSGFSRIVRLVVEDLSKKENPQEASATALSADLAYKLSAFRKQAEANMATFTQDLQDRLLPEAAFQVASYNTMINRMPNTNAVEREARDRLQEDLLVATEHQMRIISRKYGQMLLRLFEVGGFNPVALIYYPQLTVPAEWATAFAKGGFNGLELVQNFIGQYLYPRIIRKGCFTRACVTFSAYYYVHFVGLIESQFVRKITFTLSDGNTVELTPDFTSPTETLSFAGVQREWIRSENLYFHPGYRRTYHGNSSEEHRGAIQMATRILSGFNRAPNDFETLPLKNLTEAEFVAAQNEQSQRSPQAEKLNGEDKDQKQKKKKK